MKLSTTAMLSGVADGASLAPGHSLKKMAAARRISILPRWMPRHCRDPYPKGLNDSFARSESCDPGSQRVWSKLRIVSGNKTGMKQKM